MAFRAFLGDLEFQQMQQLCYLDTEWTIRPSTTSSTQSGDTHSGIILDTSCKGDEVRFEIDKNRDRPLAVIRGLNTATQEPKAKLLYVLRAAAVLLSPHCGVHQVDVPSHYAQHYSQHASEDAFRHLPVRLLAQASGHGLAYVAVRLPTLNAAFTQAHPLKFEFILGSKRYELATRNLSAASLHQTFPVTRPTMQVQVRLEQHNALHIDRISMHSYMARLGDLETKTWMPPLLHLIAVLVDHFNFHEVTVAADPVVELFARATGGLELQPLEDTLELGKALHGFAGTEHMSRLHHTIADIKDQDGFTEQVVSFRLQNHLTTGMQPSPGSPSAPRPIPLLHETRCSAIARVGMRSGFKPKPGSAIEDSE